MATKFLYDAWKAAGLKGAPLQDRPGKYGQIRWFAPDGVQWAQYDPDTDNLWLSTDLVHGDGYDDELIETIGHEVEHARQLRCGHEFNEIAAQAAGKRFLESVYTRLEERDRNEFKALKAKAALAARAFQYLPMGSSFEPAYDARRALYDLPRPKEQRAMYSYEIGLKYATIAPSSRTAATSAEECFHRLEDFSRDLHAQLVRINDGATAWQGDASYQRIETIYSDLVGSRDQPTPRSAAVARASGVADLWSRYKELLVLERAVGQQLTIFRRARGGMAAPTSAELLPMMPPAPTQPTR